MKTLKINIVNDHKLYKQGTSYQLDGDLIVISGINGSGKSQLFNIISKHGKEKIDRIVWQTDDLGNEEKLENILLLSFRDNIDLGNDFGQFSISYQKDNALNAWNFYNNNIKHSNNRFFDDRKTQRFFERTLIFDDKGVKVSSWRSILKLIDLIECNYEGTKRFNLTHEELEKIIPKDFIWRNENDIISQIGNLFYMACCDRVNKQIECSRTTEIFNNNEWLKNAPWTILNELFEELSFKYRFKNDYLFNTPNIEENPKLRDNSDIRALIDLSDGEKAILKLALTSLDEEISKDIKLVLFDEYDAPLNPSLTKSFYHVIEKFYINKGIQVIVSTHSPATISLAPNYAKFYEMFSQNNSSPKIIAVDQFDYAEIKKANQGFYSKIKNQQDRILELENRMQLVGNMLFVEDKYDQLYKIAYLKINGVEDITEANFETKFKDVCPFTIHGNFSCGGLYNRLISSNTTSDENIKIVCLFDFDSEGYRKFKDLMDKKDNQTKMFSTKNGSIREGLYIKHSTTNRFALMLPIPERLEDYVSEKTSSDCFIEVESLISEEYLQSNSKAEQRSKVLKFYKIKDKHKNDFWKDLFVVDKKHFQDFNALFDQVERIFNIKIETPQK